MDDNGPQAARSRRLQAEGAFFKSVKVPDDKKEPVGVLQSVVNEEWELQVAQLRDEKEFLTKYVQRLLNQLRQLLQKYGELDRLKAMSDPHALESEEDLDPTAMAPWLHSVEYMNPLLQAYDVKIQELEAVIEESKGALTRIATRAESLAKENSSLRQELEAAAEKAVLRQQATASGETHMTMMNEELLAVHDTGEYISEINERIDVLMAENNMLMEQVALQDDEMTSLKRDISDRDQQLLVMGQNFNQATVALQEFRDSCETLRHEKQHCEKQIQSYAAAMAQLESQKEALGEQIEAFKAERQRLEAQTTEYEALLHSVKQTADRKEETFGMRYQNVCTRLRELNTVVEAKEKRIDELEETNRSIKAELEAVRGDCEGMLQVMTSMEKQLSQYSAREDAVAELESECKEKVEDVVLEKEQIATREAQARREIARLLDRLRAETAQLLKEKDEGVETVTRKFKSELGLREEEIKSLHSELAQLRTKVDLVSRNQKDAEKQCEDACRRTREASDLFEKKLRQIAERAAAAEEARDLANHSEVEYATNLRAKDQELIKLRTEYRDRCQELNEKISLLEREVEMRRTEAREVREEAEEKSRKLQLLHDQLTKVKADCASRFANELENLHRQNRELKERVAESDYVVLQAKKEGAAALDAMRNERERAEVRLLAEIESLKTRIVALKEERNRQERLAQDADAKVSTLSMQAQHLGRDLADCQEQLMERSHAMEDAERKVTELSAQLASAITKQQQFLRQERDLRSTIERLTLERTRLEREATLCRKKLEQYRSEDASAALSRRPSFFNRSNQSSPHKRSKDPLEEMESSPLASDFVY